MAPRGPYRPVTGGPAIPDYTTRIADTSDGATRWHPPAATLPIPPKGGYGDSRSSYGGHSKEAFLRGGAAVGLTEAPLLGELAEAERQARAAELPRFPLAQRRQMGAALLAAADAKAAGAKAAEAAAAAAADAAVDATAEEARGGGGRGADAAARRQRDGLHVREPPARRSKHEQAVPGEAGERPVDQLPRLLLRDGGGGGARGRAPSGRAAPRRPRRHPHHRHPRRRPRRSAR